jgi:hypothetical protein
MRNEFSPRREILSEAQRCLWPELAQTPGYFTLYGGTAIALRLGHRQSIDFDFFARTSFGPSALFRDIRYLQGAVVRHSSANTLTVTVDRDGPVQLSFFGGLDLGQIEPANVVEGVNLSVASLIDLAGMKAIQRAEPKDYIDIHALITQRGISLAKMLAAASIIFGPQFSPLVALKAIAYHDDEALAGLPDDVKRDLVKAVQATDPQKLPALHPLRTSQAPP